MTNNSNSVSKGEESLSAISNLEIWKNKNRNNLSNSSVNDKKNMDIENGIQGNNIKELDEEENLDQELLDENLSESKDKQIKNMNDHTYDYLPAPSNKNNMINRNNIINNGNIINKEDETNGNKMNRKINQNNEINNANINMNINNGGNGINNGYYSQNMINIPSLNFIMPNYNNINEINGELQKNMMGNVGDNMNYIPIMNPQMMNMRGFIPQIQNNIAQINTLNQLNNITMANAAAMNMHILNNNNYMVNQKIPKSKYNFYKNNVNNQVPLNNYNMNKMYNNNININNKNTKNSNINNNKNEKEKQKIDIIEIIAGKDKRTTLMLRNIPNKYKLNDLVKEIDKSFWGKYDYINLPIDYERKLNLGYAFINFVDPLHIILFYETYHNKRWMLYKSDKKMDMTYADKQGKKDINCKDEQTYYAQYDTRFNFKSLNPKIEIPMRYHDYFRKIYPKSVCVEEKLPIYQNPCFQVLNLGKK